MAVEAPVDAAPGGALRSARALAARVRGALPGVVSVVVVLGLWEVLPRVGVLEARLVPPISQVLAGVPGVVGDPDFVANAASSARRWGVGLLGGVVVGVPLGLAMGRSRFVFTLFNPVLTFFYSMPKAALIVILVLWFDVGLTSMGGVVFLGALVPIVTSSYHGAAEVDPHQLWAARALGTRRIATLPRVVFPAALPRIASGVRIAVNLALLTLLGAEFLIRHRGVGTYLFNSMDLGIYDRMWTVTVMIASFGFLMDLIYANAVRRTVPWHEGEV